MQLQAIENFYLQNEVFLGKMPLTMKKTPISPSPHANPEFVCKFCNSTYRFSLGVPANQVMSEQVILELENRIADDTCVCLFVVFLSSPRSGLCPP